MGQHSSVGMRLSNMYKSHILARLYPKAPSQEDQTEEAKGIQQGSQFVNGTFTQAVYMVVIKGGGLFHGTLSFPSTVFKRINSGVSLSLESQDW